MKSKKELEYKVYRSRWTFWLLPILLVLVVALFVFLTLDATGHFGCLVVCKSVDIDREVYVPIDGRNENKMNEHTDESGENDEETSGAASKITITGEVRFPKGEEPSSLPPSFLEVKFEDVALLDAPSVLLGKQEIKIKSYKKGDKITYSFEIEKPKNFHSFFGYDVSAVLNVGWKKTKKAWIKKGDYHTDTAFPVQLNDKSNHYKRDIDLVRYNY